ncbi:Hypothetical protein DHA2_9506 [Giardia duodenalis]|uniref:Uncharacterized protein n=1 Tax=Giardia intestinalis TaxID=5741 RepID=V6TD47_GIAIN|nr:Hypothetical protein DHA2_9506 [Giardia intestinalis]
MEQLVVRDIQGTEDLEVLKKKHIALIVKDGVSSAAFYKVYNSILCRYPDDHVLLNGVFSLLMLILLDIGTERPEIPQDDALVDTVHSYYKALQGTLEYKEFLSSLRSMLPFIMQLNIDAGRLFQIILFQRTPAELRYETFASAEEIRAMWESDILCFDCGVYLKYGKSGHICTHAPQLSERLSTTQKIQRNWGPVRFEWVAERVHEPTNIPFVRVV